MLWIIPNPPALARALVGVACSHICLASVVIGLRIWVRRMTGAFGIDDWFMVAGFIASVIENGVTIWAAAWGLGYDDTAVTTAQMSSVAVPVFAWVISYTTAAVSIKTSVCSALLRLAPAQRRYRTTLRAMIVATWLVGSMTVAAQVFDFAASSGDSSSSSIANCGTDAACRQKAALKQAGFTVWTTVEFAVNMLVDTGCAVLPFCFLWKLQMPRKDKVSVMVLLALGSFAAITLAIRFPFTLQYNSETERLFYRGRAIIWANVETNTGLITGSMPAVWKVGKFVNQYFDRRVRPQQAKPPQEEEDFGLVTIGQIMGLNSRPSRGTRLGDDDSPGARDGDDGDEVIAFGRRQKPLVSQVDSMERGGYKVSVTAG